MEEFKSQKEENISQTEWALVNMVRELRGFSNKGAVPTYYAALKLATQILPSVFNEKSYMVQREHEPDVVRSYRQQAEAESRIQGVEVNPLDLLDKRMDQLTRQIATDITDKDLLKKELEKLKMVRPLFLPKNLQEDYLLVHDVKTMKFGVEPIHIEAKYSDYQVSESRIIRVRLIHPNEGEQKMGADLIYEQYDAERKKVRIIMIQYKIWNGEILYWSQAKNLDPQLKKMFDNLCSKGFCLSANGLNETKEFRYPYCCGFLRPTDRLQFKNSPLSSSGMHIPICKIQDVVEETADGNKVLRRSMMRNTSISQKIFEDCFNHCQIGSRWMDYEEAEKLYRETDILEQDERIILHVQELDI